MPRAVKPKPDPFLPTKKQSFEAVARLIADADSQAQDSNELLTEIMAAWGGIKAYSRDLVLEYQSAGEGSIVRAKILEMINRLIITNTATQAGLGSDPADMSAEELEREAEKLMAKGLAHAEHP